MSYVARSSCERVFMSKLRFCAGEERRWASVTKAWILNVSPCNYLQTILNKLRTALWHTSFFSKIQRAMHCTQVGTVHIPFPTQHASRNQSAYQCGCRITSPFCAGSKRCHVISRLFSIQKNFDVNYQAWCKIAGRRAKLHSMMTSLKSCSKTYSDFYSLRHGAYFACSLFKPLFLSITKESGFEGS